MFDLIISVIRLKPSNVLRYALINSLSTTKLLNQNFVTRTFLEKNRVLERFKIEKDLRLFIDNNLSTETIFWDIGACVGNFSIYAGAKLGKVYAFEPDGLTYSSLITNIYESSLLNITAYPIALGADDKISDFNMQEFRIANAYNTADTTLGQTGKNFIPKYTQNVCMFTAKKLITEFNFEIPTSIKLDVDGNEIEVLKGFGDVLSNKKIKSIFIELDLENPRSKECDQILLKNGFTQQLHGVGSNSYNYIYQR
jgi:FkbM family methyltransferase